MRVAVVDLGTNSTRLLVADVRAGEVSELEQQTHVTRLGQGVDADGRLNEAAMERVYGVLGGYRSAIDELGAAKTVAVATSAVRDAENGNEFRQALRERFDLEARTISGDEEAELTFLGATSGRSGGGPGESGAVEAAETGSGGQGKPVVVIDVGGGSTELVVGAPGRPPEFHVSTGAGSVRQTERHIQDDPPPPEQVAKLAVEVQVVIDTAVPAERRRAVVAGLAVAGTATSLAAIDQQLEPYDPERVDGHELRLGACEAMLAGLAGLPLEERRQVPGLHPDRAPTIVAGAVILTEAMRAFGLEAVRVSEADLLHGAALRAAAADA